MRRRCTPVVLVWLLLAGCAHAGAKAPAVGLDLYIVRHAQTLANVTKHYSVENQRTFTRTGQRQIEALVEKLRPLDLDHVVTSPTYRTLHTIAPYLAREGAVAEVWPELEECCFQADREMPPLAVVPPGDAIEIGADVERLFTFRDPAASRWYNARTYADSEAMALKAAKMLAQRFGGTGEAVLVVTHFHTGAWMLAELLGDATARELALGTAKLTHLRQTRDGSFRLVTLNEGGPLD